MATIKHAFTSAKSDGADATLVRASNWNADHVITGLSAAFIGCGLTKGTNLALSTSGEGALTMDTELWDTDGFHDNSTNNNRVTIPAGLGGKYLVTLNGRISANQDAYLIARKNGSTIVLFVNEVWNGTNSFGLCSGSTTVDLAAGDWIEFKQIATNAANLVVATGAEAIVSIAKLDSGKVGNGIGASVYKSGDQLNMTASTPAKVTYDTVTFDTDGFFDNANDRLTIPAGLAGKYLVTCNVSLYNITGSSDIQAALRVNGSDVRIFKRGDAANNEWPSFGGSMILDLVAGNYIEVWVNPGNQAGTADLRGGRQWNAVEIARLASDGAQVTGIVAASTLYAYSNFR